MARIAVLDDKLPAQIRENPDAFEGVELVWTGTDAEQLCLAARLARPAVLVVNVDLLAGTAPDNLQDLLRRTGADLVLCLYTFARRETVELLNQGKLRAVRAPVTLARLRTQMMSVIVRELLAVERPAVPASEGESPTPLFTPSQLGRLQEVRSTIDCECPNHLAELVIGLRAFEEYSARCANKDDKDKQVHETLNRATARARAELERALAVVVRHEGIVL